jgi:ABC-type sugar transport system permease subunit
MKKLKAMFKSVSHKIIDVIKNFYDQINNFLYKNVSPIIDKIKHVLSHNFVITIEHQKVVFFKKIKIKVTRKRREGFYGYLFIMLWLVGFLIFTLYPMFYSLWLSLHQAYYSVQTGVTTTFIGFRNYLEIARSQILLPLYVTYLGKMVLSVPLIVVFSILIAILINNPIKLKGFWRTIFFLPVVISTGPVINELSNQEATSLPSLQDSNVLLFISENLGPWIANPIEVLLTSMLLVLWYAGIPILIFLAGLQKIDTSIYEAASIDGASPWDRFWKITLPAIKPLISVAIIYVVVSMSLFVEPGGILELARVHMQSGASDSSLWFGYGYAAAMAWIYFGLMVILMLIFAGAMALRKGDRT